MVRRVAVGMLKGLLLGAALAAVLVAGLGLQRFGPWLWAPAACATGLFAGLLVGKPIWAPDAKVEAGLKGLAGALVAAGGLFALRTWLGWSVDLSALGAGQGPIGDLPAAALPLVAAVLGAWFQADDTAPPPARSRNPAVRVPTDGEEAVSSDLEADVEQRTSRHTKTTRA